MIMAKQNSPLPGKSELRKFVLRFGVFLLVWGLVWLHRHWKLYGYWTAGCLLLLIPSLLFPAPFARSRRWLQKISHAIGVAITIGILAVVYVAVMTPLGIAARWFGKQFLPMKPDARMATYWMPRRVADTPQSRERQY